MSMKRLGGHLGAKGTEVDLSRPLGASEVEQIDRAVQHCGVPDFKGYRKMQRVSVLRPEAAARAMAA